MKNITSLQNHLVKHWLQLQEKPRLRKQKGQFLLEGKRELELALKGGYLPIQLMFCPELGGTPELLSHTSKVELIELSKAVYQKLAYRETTEGLLAVINTKQHRLEDLILPENPLILVAEGIEKPGNMGALLRTADAAHVDAVILANHRSDVYNPNTIRSSLGSVFTTPVAIASSEDAIDFLKNKNINIFSALLQKAEPYHLQNFTFPTALVVGAEDLGLTEAWRRISTQNIIIPMQGTIDSMNVSVAAAILVFEAKRQRGFGALGRNS